LQKGCYLAFLLSERRQLPDQVDDLLGAKKLAPRFF
jgi:hypothetical protein